jgi:hypothetical protein
LKSSRIARTSFQVTRISVNDQTATPQRLVTPPRSTHLALPTTAIMTADLVTVLLQFQPESPELKQRRDYDQAARSFVSQVSNISASHWSKGADTPQDVLTVRNALLTVEALLTRQGTQSCCQLNSVRLCPPPPHLRARRQALSTGHTQAWRCNMEQASAVSRDV